MLQFPLKGIARAHRTAWGIKAHSRCILTFRFLRESWEVRQALLSRMDHTEKSGDSTLSSLRASLPCWWTPGCGPESTAGSFLSHVRAPSLAGRSKKLPRSALGPSGNSSPSKMLEMYRWLFNYTPEGTKTRGDLPVATTAAQVITEVGFWRRLALLPSTDAVRALLSIRDANEYISSCCSRSQTVYEQFDDFVVFSHFRGRRGSK